MTRSRRSSRRCASREYACDFVADGGRVRGWTVVPAGDARATTHAAWPCAADAVVVGCVYPVRARTGLRAATRVGRALDVGSAALATRCSAGRGMGDRKLKDRAEGLALVGRQD